MKGQADAEGKPRDIRVRTFEFAVRVVQLCQYLDGQPGVGAPSGSSSSGRAQE